MAWRGLVCARQIPKPSVASILTLSKLLCINKQVFGGWGAWLFPGRGVARCCVAWRGALVSVVLSPHRTRVATSQSVCFTRDRSVGPHVAGERHQSRCHRVTRSPGNSDFFNSDWKVRRYMLASRGWIDERSFITPERIADSAVHCASILLIRSPSLSTIVSRTLYKVNVVVVKVIPGKVLKFIYIKKIKKSLWFATCMLHLYQNPR